MTLVDRALLPLTFDPAPVAAEVAALPAEAWTPHFNTAQYEGDWSGVALRAAVGAPLALYPDPTATEYEPTAWLDRCPETARLLERIPLPLLTARFLRLGAGSQILPHRDYRLSATDGEARLHLPVTSHPGVGFELDGRAVDLAPGTCWYLDLDRTHAATNRGPGARVHLVVDTMAETWLLERLAQTT